MGSNHYCWLHKRVAYGRLTGDGVLDSAVVDRRGLVWVCDGAGDPRLPQELEDAVVFSVQEPRGGCLATPPKDIDSVNTPKRNKLEKHSLHQ